MNAGRTRKLLEAVYRLALWGSFAAIIVLIVTYFVASNSASLPKSAQDFITGLCVELIPVFLLFALSYLLFRAIQEVREEEREERLIAQISSAVIGKLPVMQPAGNHLSVWERFIDLPWDDLLRGSRSVDIVVHYFDTWINTHRASLKSILDDGGSIRVVLPNPRNAALVNSIKARFPEYDAQQVRKKIENTYAKLKLVHGESTHKQATVQAFYVDEPVWYCAVVIDGQHLVLSPFEHARQVAISSPATLISLRHHPGLRKWFDKEFSYLVDKSMFKDGA